jgi:retinol dehydrogenase-16
VTCCILEPGVFKTALIDENAENARVEKAWKRMSQSVRDEYGEEFKEICKQHINEYVIICLVKTNWNKFYQSIGSPRLDYVVDSYYHAITARYPRYRYRVGYDSMFVYIPMSFMPTEISDGIFRLLTRLASGGKAILPKALQ